MRTSVHNRFIDEKLMRVAGFFSCLTALLTYKPCLSVLALDCW